MFVIVDPSSGCYFAKDHRKIILFETYENALYFANSFKQYSNNRIQQEESPDPSRLLEVFSWMPSIIQWDEKSVGAETILFSEIKP